MAAKLKEEEATSGGNHNRSMRRGEVAS